MDVSIYNLLGIIWLTSAIAMLITWLIQFKTKDASYVDVVWAAGIGIASIYTFVFYTDYSLRKIIIFLCPLFWSLRLAYYLTKRLMVLKEEDSRYQAMRAALSNKDKLNTGFFIFFQLQGLFIVIFSTPIVFALVSDVDTIRLIDICGLLIFSIALLGESLSDRQLLAYKKQYGSNTTCRIGMWQYSRHPNYFFEWMHWFAYAYFCYNTSYFWLSLIMPFLMLFFIVYLTGIPHVERQALLKKEDYKDYIKTTPMLVPNFFKMIKDIKS